MSKIVLIDGYSILHRTFYGLPDLTNAEGLHTNAIYGFINVLFRILDEEKADYLAVAFDSHAPTFRHQIYKEYKGTRKPMPEELRQQIPVADELLKAMNIKVVKKPGLEADDILGIISKRCEKMGLEVTIVSGDRDLLQLASDSVKVRIPKTKAGGTEIEDYNTQEVIDRFSVEPIRIIDLKALMGDSSDNIPGVPSIGEKTATKLLVEYGSVDGIYEHLDEVKPDRARKALTEHRDLCELSRTLATICTEGDIDFELEASQTGGYYTPEAYEIFKRLNFKKFLGRFESAPEPSSDIGEGFTLLRDKKTVDKFLSELKSVDKAGVAMSDEAKGIAVSTGGNTVFIPGIYRDKALECLKGKMIYCCELKKILHLLYDDTADDPDIDTSYYRDVIIGAYLINPLKNDYSYDGIALEYCNLTVKSLEELTGKKGKVRYKEEQNGQLSFDGLSDNTDIAEELTEYMTAACYESAVAVTAGPVIVDKLTEQGMYDLYKDIEMPLVPVLYEMERNGIAVRRDQLEEYGKNLSEGIDELADRIYTAAGEEFNIQSPKQLGVILFEKLQLPSGKKTKTGYSTAADVLEKLAGEHSIVSDILEYRTLTKLRSTYAEGLAGYIAADGRIHGTFNQTITATGRISSTEPNLQNIPVRMELGRQIRKIFVPRDGYSFLDADYSQVELRILASLSEDENLINAYRNAVDIHSMTASTVFHIPLEEVTDKERRSAKAVNFGIVYGISSFGLGQDLKISRKEAEGYINSYFETYPGVKRYLDDTVSFAKEKGYVLTAFARRRPIPELRSANFMQRSFGERVAMNSPIQGTAADIMKIAMIDVYRKLKKNKLSSKLVLQVHDELIIETAPGEEEAVREILISSMTGSAQMAVPLEVDVKQGNNWMEAH